jgi:acetolactate decarboxylase
MNDPYIQVVDTDFSKGRLGLDHRIYLNDLEKFHGHLCDGLVVGFLALKEGLKELYSDGVVDRTNTRIVSKPSPCLTDAAAYLTGGRMQFNTFYVSPDINGLFVIQRIDDEKAVAVNMKPGVKPKLIDDMGNLAAEGKLSPCELDTLKTLEDEFSERLLREPASDNFEISPLDNFDWKPVLRNDFLKTDILNKNAAPCTR